MTDNTQTYARRSVAEYFGENENAARLGTAYWRAELASAMGDDRESFTFKELIALKRSVTAEQIAEYLPAIMVRVCEYAVSREGIAHKTGFTGAQTHLRNAFDVVSNATVRFSDKGSIIEPTGEYAKDSALTRVAFRGVDSGKGYSAMIGIKTRDKTDILDQTQVTDAGVGDSADALDLKREASLSHIDQERIENQRTIGEQCADHHQPLGVGRSEPSEREPEPRQDARMIAWQKEHGKRTRALRASLDKLEQRNEELLRLLRTNNRLLKKANLA